MIAAATTYELSAACFTMRDMDELARMIDEDEIEAGEPADTLRVCGMQVDQNKIWQSAKAAPGDVWNGMRDLFPEEIPDLTVLNTEAQRGWIFDQFDWAKDKIGID